MVKNLLTLLTFSLLSWSLAAQCPAGNVFLNSQADVDQFLIDYPTCTELPELLRIDNAGMDTDITDLSALSNLTIINGSLVIENNPLLTSFAGLENMTTIGEQLIVDNNDGVTSLSGLDGISTVGTNALVAENDALTSLDGLEGLMSAGSALSIRANPVLTNIDAIANFDVATIPLFVIQNNTILSECAIQSVCTIIADNPANATISGNAAGCANQTEVEADCNAGPACPMGDVFLFDQEQVDSFLILYPTCTTIDGNLVIGDEFGSSDITNLSALSGITTINGGCYFYNTQLTNFAGVGNVSTLSGECVISGNSQITNLNGLGAPPGFTITNLTITNNALLTEITAFSMLTSISGDLTISNNGSLTSFNGLQNLTSIGGGCFYNNNTALTSIELISLTSVGGALEITGNTSLSNCAIAGVCDAINAGGSILISGNGAGCTSLAEVQAECALVGGGGASAMNFDGQNDYLELPSSLSTQITAELSVQAWFRVETFSSGRSIVHNLEWTTNGGLFSGYAISTFGSDGVEGIISTTDNDLVRVQYNGINTGEWYHVTMTYDGEIVTLYINGEEVGIGVASGSIDYSPAPVGLYIGRYRDTNEDVYFDGDIDEVRLWDRALNCVEIPQQYACELAGTEPNLVAYYQFTQGIAEGDNTGMTEVVATTGPNCTINNMALMGATSNFITDGGVATGVSCGPIMNPSFTLSSGGTEVQPNTALGGFMTTVVGESMTLATIEIDAFLTEFGAPSIDNPAFSIVDNGGSFDIVFSPQAAGQETGMITIGLEDCLGISIFGFSVVANAIEGMIEDCPQGDVTFTSQAEVDAFVAAYPNCTTISGDFRIGRGNGVTDITNLTGLSSITTVEGMISFALNSSLTSLAGFEGLTTVQGGVCVFNNDALVSLAGLDSLNFVGAQVHIFGNDAMTSFSGLGSLQTIGGDLRVRFNDALASLSGLDALSTIGSYLAIYGNGSLTNLNALSSVSSIGSFLAIRSNTTLTDISGLINIDANSIDRLYITGNTSLTTCNIQVVCDYLSVESNLAAFVQNGIDCNSRAEVEAACDDDGLLDDQEDNLGIQGAGGDFSNFTPAEIQVYPNPTNGLVQIRNVEAQRVTIFNPQGQRMAQYDTPGTQLDMSNLPAGVYYLSFETAEGPQTKRVVKIN